MFFTKKSKRSNFSLIELLIVIGIMGALAALILPAFSESEASAKDTACDYNQAGTIRYLNMFRSANGFYPTGYHTGGDDDAWTKAIDADDNGEGDLTLVANHNFMNASTTTPLFTDETSAGAGDEVSYVGSLEAAGIVSLASGVSVAKEIDGMSVKTVTASADADTATWTESLNPVTGEIADVADREPLTVRGVNLGWIADAGTKAYASLDDAQKMFKTATEGNFVIAPLYVAPTMDWENFYSDGPNPSKVSVAMAGKCPWGDDGQARYYIAFFKIYDNGDAAKLLATSCPDCGILDANLF